MENNYINFKADEAALNLVFQCKQISLLIRIMQWDQDLFVKFKSIEGKVGKF